MRCASNRVGYGRRAFTLVEILVVLALLLFLGALLLPVFNSARSAARTATCQSNLRQIGTAMQMYLSDYNRLYPSLLAHPLNCSWSYNIARYTKSDAVFTCPEDPNKFFQSGCPAPKAEGDLRFNFKGGYSFDVPSYSESAQMSDIRVKSPSAMVLVLDGDGDHLGAPHGKGLLSTDDLTNMAVALRHKGSANCLFADGHVKWLPFDELIKRDHWTLSGRDS